MKFIYLKMIFLMDFGKTNKYEYKYTKLMSYAHPEVLVDTKWVSLKIPLMKIEN